MPSARRPATSADVGWEEVEPAPLVLVSGPEAVLAERAVDRVVALARQADAQVEVTRLDAAAYEAGRLRVVASASLFEEPRVVVLENVQAGTDELFTDLVAHVEDPGTDVVLVLVHAGGQRGRRALDAVRAAGAVVVRCDAVKGMRTRWRSRRPSCAAAAGAPSPPPCVRSWRRAGTTSVTSLRHVSSSWPTRPA